VLTPSNKTSYYINMTGLILPRKQPTYRPHSCSYGLALWCLVSVSYIRFWTSLDFGLIFQPLFFFCPNTTELRTDSLATLLFLSEHNRTSDRFSSRSSFSVRTHLDSSKKECQTFCTL